SAKVDFSPGKSWRYSNTGFLLLGFIIENVSKVPFKHYVKENIFDKLGMKSSVAGNGSGSGVSTSADMVTFLSGLKLNQLLTATTTKQLLEYTVKGQYG